MPRPRGNRKTARLTVSLDEQAHTTLAAFAAQQDVSIAWMIRRAVLEFIERRERLDQHELPLRRHGTSVVQQAMGDD